MKEPLLSDIIYIIIYVLLWAIALFKHQRKRKIFDCSTLILLLYFICAIFSLFLYFDSNYGYQFRNLNLISFLLLFILLLFVAKPVLSYKSEYIKHIVSPNMKLLNIIALIFICTCLLSLFDVITNLSNGLMMMMADDTYIMDLYNDNSDYVYSAGTGISNLRSIISNALTEFGIFITFYYLTIENANKKIVIGLLLSCFVKTFGTIYLGQRGIMIETMLLIIATYLLFKSKLPAKVNKIIKSVIVLFVSFVILFFTLMTITRFGGDNKVTSSIYFYAGQENLVFNKYALDNNGIRYGDRTIPLFKRIIGFDNVPNNYLERRIKYKHLSVNDEVFITHIGDVMLDYGPILGIIIMLTITSIIINKTKVRHKSITFHQLILIHATLYLCLIGGFKLYPFADVGGNLKMIVYLTTYLIFCFDYNITKHKRIYK